MVIEKTSPLADIQSGDGEEEKMIDDMDLDIRLFDIGNSKWTEIDFR